MLLVLMQCRASDLPVCQNMWLAVGKMHRNGRSSGATGLCRNATSTYHFTDNSRRHYYILGFFYLAPVQIVVGVHSFDLILQAKSYCLVVDKTIKPNHVIGSSIHGMSLIINHQCCCWCQTRLMCSQCVRDPHSAQLLHERNTLLEQPIAGGDDGHRRGRARD